MEQFASRNYRISNNKTTSTRPSLENLHSMQTSSLSQQQQRATLGFSPGYGSSVAYPNLEGIYVKERDFAHLVALLHTYAEKGIDLS